MKVLVACEESQTVCKAFRARGHEAYSCDIIPCSGGHPEWHIQEDALKIINGRCQFKTCDGLLHHITGKWDLLIAHPPCTKLSNVATRSFSLKCSSPEKVVKRWEDRAIAAVFFMQFILADCEKICVENPVGFMTKAYRKPDQYIEPYQFVKSVNDEEYRTKKTGIWLKGLPLLRFNSLPKPNNKEIYGIMPSGKAKTWEDTLDRSGGAAKARSKTPIGIAKAMAEQWG